jgi:hypothetical protein
MHRPMARDGTRNDSRETPAEARRRRLGESLRANLRRRKERDRQRAETDRTDRAGGADEAGDRGGADDRPGGETGGQD